MRFHKFAAPLTAALLLAFSPAATLAQDAGTADEVMTREGWSKPPAEAERFMISTANPLATRAGHDVLARGGSAIDAMVAAQLVLGLVEPQSSGLGGGAFLVYWDAENSRLTTLDGRETAPMAAGPDLFLGDNGDPMGFFEAVIGGRSVGTPGTVALLAEAHARYGRLPWAELFDPAIALAEEGFEVSPRLNKSIEQAAESLFRFPATRAYFLSEEGVPLFPGTIIRNAAYADTLRQIAENGADAFYSGPIAADIVDAVRNAPGNPGFLELEDLAKYSVKERAPVCVTYRANEVCGMGPPSSGALTVGQILKLVEPYGLAERGADDPESWRLIGDATRLAFADRNLYMADSDFVTMPKGLLNTEYLAERSKLLSGDKALPPEEVVAGEPPMDHALLLAPDTRQELPATSHLSIVDPEGNVVSLTTTIENGFGSRLMVRGFLLNNELTDFSFVPERDGKTVANRVEGGKRPRSSMSPTIVLKDGKPVLATGSPGGSRIIPYVAKTVIAHLDWGMDAQAAAALPHLVNRYGVFELEEGTAAEKLAGPLRDLGYPTETGELVSGIHTIAIAPGKLTGGADPRREGVASGE